MGRMKELYMEQLQNQPSADVPRESLIGEQTYYLVLIKDYTNGTEYYATSRQYLSKEEAYRVGLRYISAKRIDAADVKLVEVRQNVYRTL